MRLHNSMAVSIVDCDVCRPAIISTPFCTGTGFMKCVLITLEAIARSVGLSLFVAAAIWVTLIDEVLVASMACGGQILAREEKISFLSDGISGTASITKSTSESLSISVVVSNRRRAESASDADTRPFDTSLASKVSIKVVRRS